MINELASTRGMRNNNPFNIKRSDNLWKGKIPHNFSTDCTFEQFKSLDYGLRAGLLLIANYINMGFNTPRLIINRFAPSSENNVRSYLDYISKTLKDLDQVINPWSVPFYALCRCILYFESRYYPSDDVLYTVAESFGLTGRNSNIKFHQSLINHSLK